MNSDALRQQSYISKLTLTNFRNYAALSLDLAPGAVVLSGDNGAGKTNLLEAISFLTPGRGLRRAPHPHRAREGGDGGFALHARIEGPEGQVEIGTGISGGDAAGEGGRRVRINGTSARSAEDMLEWLRV
ncbi:MAG: DNA replication and repair protein RecF, partial [Mesorhizobium sp.]